MGTFRAARPTIKQFILDLCNTLSFLYLSGFVNNCYLLFQGCNSPSFFIMAQQRLLQHINLWRQIIDAETTYCVVHLENKLPCIQFFSVLISKGFRQIYFLINAVFHRLFCIMRKLSQRLTCDKRLNTKRRIGRVSPASEARRIVSSPPPVFFPYCPVPLSSCLPTQTPFFLCLLHVWMFM